MKTKYLVLTVLIVSYSTVLLISLFSEGILFLEWTVSLLPYWLVVNIFILITLLFRKPLLRIAFFALLLTTIFIIIRFLSPTDTYPSTSGDGQGEVKIAFLNKYRSNTNYEEINKKIKMTNPDFIGLAELGQVDRQNLSSLEQYQCMQIKNVRNDFDLAFFSKYPCFPDEISSRFRYVLSVKMQMSGRQYRVFLVHTLSPISPQWLAERDQELNQLAAYIGSLPDENIILLGDLNVSPWSQTFQKFKSRLKNLKNAASRQNLLFTWSSFPINVQIDYIFLPNKASVEEFKAEEIKGSDHNLIWTKARI